MPATPVPSAVAYCTVTAEADVFDKNTVKLALALPASPSRRMALPMVRLVVLLSSSTIRPVPWLRRRLALMGLLRLRTKVRLAWAMMLPSTGTLMVALVWPAGMVSVPEVKV